MAHPTYTPAWCPCHGRHEHQHVTFRPTQPVLMARPASLPCPECEGMLSKVLGAVPLSCPCGEPLRVDETREDPEHPLAPAVWRIRRCGAGDELATVQFGVPGGSETIPGTRHHQCADCGAVYSSLERPVSIEEARGRLAHLARERYMLAQAGRRFSHPRGQAVRRAS